MTTCFAIDNVERGDGRYAAIWEKEGAVDPAVGACRVLHEVMNATMERTGMFINCEDGLEIPW